MATDTVSPLPPKDRLLELRNLQDQGPGGCPTTGELEGGCRTQAPSITRATGAAITDYRRGAHCEQSPLQGPLFTIHAAFLPLIRDSRQAGQDWLRQATHSAASPSSSVGVSWSS